MAVYIVSVLICYEFAWSEGLRVPMRWLFIVGSVVAMLCSAVIAGAEVRQSASVAFEPPLPETVRSGDTGHFRVSVGYNGGPRRLASGVNSTNPAVLSLQPDGDRWLWQAGVSGDTAIRVQDEGRTVLSQVVRSRNHNVALRTVYVVPEWHGFVHGEGGWPLAAPVKESQNLKYFEAAIWVGKRAVHLYEFDDSFEPVVPSRTPEEYAAHRESFMVMQFPGLPVPPEDTPYTRELSFFLRQTFKEIATYLVSRYPDSDHHFIFDGHGAAGGHLIEYRMHADDADEMLAHWTAALERPLGVIDMGGPCDKAGYEDLANFCRHAQFYVASDMPNGGYGGMDEWTYEKHLEVQPDLQYHRLFTEEPDLRRVLVERTNLMRRAYFYSRQNMIENQWQQATSLFSCQDWQQFHQVALPFLSELSADPSIPWNGRFDDLLTFLVTNGAEPALIEAFRRVIVHRVDNSDFFEWQEIRNGITLPARWWSELDK